MDQIDENENSTQKNGMVPPRWIRLYKDGEFTAEILLSIMMQIDESAPVPTIVSRIPPSLCPAMRKFKSVVLNPLYKCTFKHVSIIRFLVESM